MDVLSPCNIKHISAAMEAANDSVPVGRQTGVRYRGQYVRLK